MSRTRRRGGASSSSRPTARHQPSSGRDAEVSATASRTCEGRAPRTTRSTGSSILSEMQGKAHRSKRTPRARVTRGAVAQRVRVLDGVRPPPSLCGACVAADCGGAPCRDHARPGLQKETMATVAAPGAFDVYAVKLPSAGCVPPCPRCGASAGHAALPQSAPRLYRLASRSRTAAGSPRRRTLRARAPGRRGARGRL